MNVYDNLHGCYLLHCNNPKKGYRGRVYIGYTVDPVKRIGQHNGGASKGGARKTSGKAPWDMTLFVHGFPSNIAALRFEYAWQQPRMSRRLRHLPAKTRKETQYDYRIRLLSEMLNTPPWSRLPLTVNWLCLKYRQTLNPPPPPHVQVREGFVGAFTNQKDAKMLENEAESNPPLEAIAELDDSSDSSFLTLADKIQGKKPKMPKMAKPQDKRRSLMTGVCDECEKEKSEELVFCPKSSCPAKFHLTCVGNQSQDQLIPIEFKCKVCFSRLSWVSFIALCAFSITV